MRALAWPARSADSALSPPEGFCDLSVLHPDAPEPASALPWMTEKWLPEKAKNDAVAQALPPALAAVPLTAAPAPLEEAPPAGFAARLGAEPAFAFATPPRQREVSALLL
jgi:hypothetical protein